MHPAQALAPVFLTLLSAAAALPAQARSPRSDTVFDTITLYGGRGADHNLRELPRAVPSAEVDWDRTYFTGLGLSKQLGQLGDGITLLRDTPLGALGYGYEGIVVKHRGLQDNMEAGAVGKLMTPWLFVGPVGVNAALGVGMSHAFGKPSYEDGPASDPQRRYRTQLLLTFDLEWKIRGADDFSVVTRVHHRSGAYGLVAPRRVGSNFLALGLRYHF
ncbi:MAG: hypothetical protein JWP65_3622 [Ramlibacter sp.]|jgi:hypothetical protein|uniref:hypothetical protein n=1 Tax=Ramlibacter sp. TaxID=1917967 RepID=UPI002605EAD8|nr:hypothetical protein [Ramlibacter sp.]MDB5753201.1 hypothetical protein [Ramlibacter sp.]